MGTHISYWGFNGMVTESLSIFLSQVVDANFVLMDTLVTQLADTDQRDHARLVTVTTMLIPMLSATATRKF